MSHAVGVQTPMTPRECVLGFIEAINRRDVEHLASLMADHHRLQVLDEAPLEGKSANLDAWRGYMASYPSYVIYPHRIVERDDVVVVLGHTTGSHLDLADEDEAKLTVIWRAQVTNSLLTLWEIKEDTPAQRAELCLPSMGDG
jgi:ketosteroid isomerase-like protein